MINQGLVPHATVGSPPNLPQVQDQTSEDSVCDQTFGPRPAGQTVGSEALTSVEGRVAQFCWPRPCLNPEIAFRTVLVPPHAADACPRESCEARCAFLVRHPRARIRLKYQRSGGAYRRMACGGRVRSRTAPGWCGPGKRYTAVQQLLAEGHSLNAICQQLLLDRGTLRRFARAAQRRGTAGQGDQPDRDAGQVHRAPAHPVSAPGSPRRAPLHAELRQVGFTGSVQTVRRWFAPAARAVSRGYRRRPKPESVDQLGR